MYILPYSIVHKFAEQISQFSKLSAISVDYNKTTAWLQKTEESHKFIVVANYSIESNLHVPVVLNSFQSMYPSVISAFSNISIVKY